ncbi:hypothetical protein JOQ06_020358 [Pogonophryne albipinna]|uniref:Uncharacterized protein n=1 Tax=Pogonophryne albipinna TaxID=1090488 RepID=A0AAD6BP29_9TELE|nr:hypothetical protein JOQ06_020358 [Pogonophryne albipinna]
MRLMSKFLKVWSLGFLTTGSRSYGFWFPVLSVCVFLLLAVGAGGYFLKLKFQRRHPPDCSVPETKPPPPYVGIRASDVDSDLQHVRTQVDRPGKQHLETQSITVT